MAPPASRCSTNSTRQPSTQPEIINLAVVAKASLADLVKFANKEAGNDWRRLSPAGKTYTREYHGETADDPPLWARSSCRRRATQALPIWQG